MRTSRFCFFFFFNDTATTEIYTLSLHDALPILRVEYKDEVTAGNGAKKDKMEGKGRLNNQITFHFEIGRAHV